MSFLVGTSQNFKLFYLVEDIQIGLNFAGNKHMLFYG